MQRSKQASIPGILLVMAFGLGLSSSVALAAEPEYSADPFGDSDFDDAQFIERQAHPGGGRGEVSLLFTSSVINKYNAHVGGLLELNYRLPRVHWLVEMFGVAVTVGYMHGQLTNIVTDEAGILGARVRACITDSCTTLDPSVPDYRQITGMVEGYLTFTPLYGKINLISELDLNMELTFMVGGGVNGTRLARATLLPNATQAGDYQLSGQGFGDAGFLNDAFANFSTGLGLRIFLTEWLDLRGDVRLLVYRDEFDFGDGLQSYPSDYILGQVGFGFILF